jgi:uncharacterized delta-60 repeat protein
MSTTRYQHTATLLPNGKVLICGGQDNTGPLSDPELYDPATGTWHAPGPMNAGRAEHTATLLPDGKCLLAGGLGNQGSLSSAELYDDSATPLWMPTGALNKARDDHTANLLPDGRVLVVGGFDESLPAPISASELYYPARGTWTVTGSLNIARDYHTATLLPNGKVLVAGGFGNSFPGPLSSAELYDPAVGAWTATGPLNFAHYFHTATLLPDGKVLVVGGADSLFRSVPASELYDPATGTWTATGSLNTPRFHHTETLLPSGKVLVAGGVFQTLTNSTSLSSAELYDPATGTWAATGAMNSSRAQHSATSLPNGKVLVVGFDSAELYDPASGTWTPTGSLNTPQPGHTALLLPNGKVLIAGGSDAFSRPSASAELYEPASGSWSPTEPLNAGRWGHTMTLLPTGKVLVAAGFGIRGDLASAELYTIPAANSPPSVTCPGPSIVECAGLVPPPIAIVDDADCDPLRVVWSLNGIRAYTNDLAGCPGPPPHLPYPLVPYLGPPLPLGSNLLEITVTDTASNSASCSTTISVQDSTPPELSEISADPDVLWPPNHKWVDVRVRALASDTCGSASWKIIGVTSSEHDDSSALDWQITGEHTLRLLAERSGEGNGRIYTITIQATDSSGNLSDPAEVRVRVPHSQPQPR